MTLKILWAFAAALSLANCSTPTEKPKSQQAPQTKQALIIGTFHYNNPGADVAKTKNFDIMGSAAQDQLEEISEKIKDFAPDRVFVEWPYDEQSELDSLYQLYLEDRYFSNDSLSNFYLKNEIFQLAFRTAKKIGLPKVTAIDYNNTEFPFDSVMTVVATQKQKILEKEFSEGIQQFTQVFDEKIESGSSLLELTYYLNTEEMRQLSNRFHTQTPLLVGDQTNFIGPYLAAEWHKRNLYMWSLAQKATQKNDQRIVLLLGASHIATIKDFIDQNKDWGTVELEELFNFQDQNH